MNPFSKTKGNLTTVTPLEISSGVKIATGLWVITFHPYKAPICTYDTSGLSFLGSNWVKTIWINYICFGYFTIEFFFHSLPRLFGESGNLIRFRTVDSIDKIPVPLPGEERYLQAIKKGTLNV